MNKRLIEMTDCFTDEAINDKLKVGQTLTFNTEDGQTSYKIMKIKHGRLFAKEIKLYRPEEFVIVDKPTDKVTWKDKVTK